MDTRLAQLQHRRRHLPEHEQLATLHQERAAAGEDLVAARTVRSDLEAEQAKAEADLEPVRERLARNQRRIADGTVADAKALAGLVDEVEHLNRRIGDLEDAELDVMQRLEDATSAESGLADKASALDAQVVEMTARRDTEVGGIDEQARAAAGEREQLSAGVPPELITLYDRIRAQHGGVGAAELKRRRCTGCQLELNASDLQRFAAAAPDEILRCEECSRILIRTDESGL